MNFCILVHETFSVKTRQVVADRNATVKRRHYLSALDLCKNRTGLSDTLSASGHLLIRKAIATRDLYVHASDAPSRIPGGKCASV
jgi:hypothetical protein